MTEFPTTETDAFASRRRLLAAVLEAVLRYADESGTKPSVAAAVAAAYLEDYSAVLRTSEQP